MEQEWDKVGNSTDRMWNGKDSNLSIGDEITGRYVEKNEHIGDNDTTIYILEVGSERVGVWSSTVLAGRLDRIAFGKMVKLVYQGKKDSPKRKGKQYHDFDVFQGHDYPGDESGH
jgi:hypothetical protein